MIDAVLFDLGDTIIDFGIGRREVEILFRQGAKLTYEDLRSRRHPNLPPVQPLLQNQLSHHAAGVCLVQNLAPGLFPTRTSFPGPRSNSNSTSPPLI